MNKLSKALTLILIVALCAVSLFACTKNTTDSNQPQQGENGVTDENEFGVPAATAGQLKDDTIQPDKEKNDPILGREENIKFVFTVTHSDKSKVEFKIETSKDNLGDALLDGNIVKGEVGEYGLYVTEVDGEVADWNTDQSYWYFYKNGEALMTGVSSTPIAEGDSFEAVYTK